MTELTVTIDESTQEMNVKTKGGIPDKEKIAILFSAAIGLSYQNGLDRQSTLAHLSDTWIEMIAKEED